MGKLTNVKDFKQVIFLLNSLTLHVHGDERIFSPAP